VLDEGRRGQRRSGLFRDEQQIDERRAVAVGRFRPSHRGGAQVGELPPQLLVVTQRLGGAHALRRALVREEFMDGVAHGFLVAAEGVVGVTQFEPVHEAVHRYSMVRKVSISHRHRPGQDDRQARRSRRTWR